LQIDREYPVLFLSWARSLLELNRNLVYIRLLTKNTKPEITVVIRPVLDDYRVSIMERGQLISFGCRIKS
jgi:hypothetical protein